MHPICESSCVHDEFLISYGASVLSRLTTAYQALASASAWTAYVSTYHLVAEHLKPLDMSVALYT